jgi:hypothetical protein
MQDALLSLYAIPGRTLKSTHHAKLDFMENTYKDALLIAVSILAAPRLASQLDTKDSPRRETVIREAVRDAEHILRNISNLHFRTEDLALPQT